MPGLGWKLGAGVGEGLGKAGAGTSARTGAGTGAGTGAEAGLGCSGSGFGTEKKHFIGVIFKNRHLAMLKINCVKIS